MPSFHCVTSTREGLLLTSAQQCVIKAMLHEWRGANTLCSPTDGSNLVTVYIIEINHTSRVGIIFYYYCRKKKHEQVNMSSVFLLHKAQNAWGLALLSWTNIVYIKQIYQIKLIFTNLSVNKQCAQFMERKLSVKASGLQHSHDFPALILDTLKTDASFYNALKKKKKDCLNGFPN